MVTALRGRLLHPDYLAVVFVKKDGTESRRNGVKAERKQVPETVRQATEDVDPSVNFIMALQSECGWICGDGKEGGFPNTKFVRTKVSPGN